MSKEYKEYFKSLEDGVNDLYEVAKRAREKGLDPVMEPEPQITQDIAERIEKLIGPYGITERMRELEGMNRREMAFKVAEEIALGRFGQQDKQAGGRRPSHPHGVGYHYRGGHRRSDTGHP
jgi:DNA polymerase II large subunit